MKRKTSDESDPIMRIGRYRIRRSRLKQYLDNISDGREFDLFDNPRSNKMTGTFIKNNIGKIIEAVKSK